MQAHSKPNNQRRQAESAKIKRLEERRAKASPVRDNPRFMESLEDPHKLLFGHIAIHPAWYAILSKIDTLFLFHLKELRPEINPITGRLTNKKWFAYKPETLERGGWSVKEQSARIRSLKHLGYLRTKKKTTKRGNLVTIIFLDDEAMTRDITDLVYKAKEKKENNRG